MLRNPAAFFTALLLLPASAAAQTRPATPEDAALPRFLTPAEELYLKEHPLAVPLRAVTPPPRGDVRCVAEYEPMDGILMAWEGSGGWTAILARMAASITTVGDAQVFVAVDTTAERTTALNAIAAQGADMARVRAMVVPTDSIWMRDYGPRYVYQGEVRSIVDHTYNRPRPRDDQFPTFFSGYAGHARYELPLIHGGGNFHLDAPGNSFVTRLINNENPSLSEQEIHDIWLDYQNVDTSFFTPLPQGVDSTQHIDMWMQVVSDTDVVISEWPAQAGSTQAQICDAAASQMAAAGYSVHRTPARALGSGFKTHYTYTNVVMCNDLVLIPSYTNATIVPYNAPALAVWQQACPTKTIVQVDAQAIVSAAGVLHCIVMHLPRHVGGTSPTAYVVTPDGGEVLSGGATATIEWVSDDDVGVTGVDLLLSLDGGTSFPTTLATGLPRSGSFAWTVPTTSSSRARIRAVARDADAHSGMDESDADFVISGTDPLAAATPYGTGKPGTLGVPQLDATLPILGGLVTLELTDALPGGLAGFLLGFAPASIPFDGATILVSPITTLQVPIDGAGRVSLPLNVPTSSALAGLSVYWQAWIPSDPSATGMGWAASNGLETVLGY